MPLVFPKEMSYKLRKYHCKRHLRRMKRLFNQKNISLVFFFRFN